MLYIFTLLLLLYPTPLIHTHAIGLVLLRSLVRSVTLIPPPIRITYSPFDMLRYVCFHNHIYVYLTLWQLLVSICTYLVIGHDHVRKSIFTVSELQPLLTSHPPPPIVVIALSLSSMDQQQHRVPCTRYRQRAPSLE